MPIEERKFVMVDRKPEFDLAWEIIRQLVAPAIEQNPTLDLCMVRQFAEMMFKWQYPKDFGAKEACEPMEVPTVTGGPSRSY